MTEVGKIVEKKKVPRNNVVEWYINEILNNPTGKSFFGVCQVCHERITGYTYPRLKHIKYCSPECRKIASRTNQRKRKQSQKLKTIRITI